MTQAMVADVHCHTEQSGMDGMSRSKEAVARAVRNGMTALAITDHGTCAGHIEHQRECLKAGINPIFGTEAYFQDDRLERPAPGDKEAQKRLHGGRHLIILAQGDRGLRDLWDASSEAFATGFYHKPRMDWDVLEEHGRDWTVTTSCLGGVVAKDVIAGYRDRARMDRAIATLGRLKSLFPGRLYLELQANSLQEQYFMNKLLVVFGRELGIPLVVASDGHYPAPEDKWLHDEWMRCRTGKADDDYWHFSHMTSEQEIRENLRYLDNAAVEQALRSTAEIAERCEARISGKTPPPVFTPGGGYDDDARMLRGMCEANWGLVSHLGSAYRDRMEREFQVIADKKLAGCYLIVEDIVRYVRSGGGLVGPGRGSDAGSLVSYLLSITSVDPLDAGLLFERFLTQGRESLPDFDLDFQTSWRPRIQDHAMRRYGTDHVVRVGTVMRYGAKGILDKLFSVHKRELAEEAEAHMKEISEAIDSAEAGTAGLGLPWDEIVQEPVVAGYSQKYAEIFEIARHLVHRVYAVGQHPAGLIISPQSPIAGKLPMRRADGKDLPVSQWDYRAAEELGLMKIDILTLRNLDSIAEALRLIEARTGQRMDPRDWDPVRHQDPQVYDEIGTGNTLGVFQLETRLCAGYAKRQKPRNLKALADLTTFIRPGPRNSGATEQYLRRLAGLEEVDYPHPLLEEILSTSFGVMLYQEDVLRTCQILAGYSELEADDVRKILGKKLTEKVDAAGEEFVRRCVERGHDETLVRELWLKMAEFGKYAFNKAHGYSYGVLSYWTAWLKTHYPVEMTAAILSTIDKEKRDRMPLFATEARRKGITILPPDVRFSGREFSPGPMSVRYGLSAILGVGPAAIVKIVSGQPYGSYEDFLDRSGVDAGVLRALAQAGALDPLVPTRHGLMRAIEAARDGSDVRCVHKITENSGPGGLPCCYDWDADRRRQEEIHETLMAARTAEGRKRLKLAVKNPPARCTVACRRYTPPAMAGMAAWPEFTPAEMFRQEWELFGTWMSPRLFESLDDYGPGTREMAAAIARSIADAPPGTYPVAAVLADKRTAMTRTGNVMWWVSLATEVSVIRAACFSPRGDSDPDVPAALRRVRPGALVSASLERRAYKAKTGERRMSWRLASVTALGD